MASARPLSNSVAATPPPQRRVTGVGDDVYLPVRSVRVVYALPNDLRQKAAESRLFNQQRGRLALEAHEYLVRHSGLGPTNQQTRRLIRTALASHVP